MGYRELMRRKLLEDIYDKMSDEEKRAFVQLTIQNKDHTEIMQALQGISRQVDEGKHSFKSDLIANISGNIITDGLIFLGKSLFRKL